MKKVDEIRREIAKRIASNEQFTKNDLLRLFPDNGPLLAYALKTAVDEKVLVKRGVTRGASYQSAEPVVIGDRLQRTYARGKMSEEDIFAEIQDAFLSKYELSENVESIVTYGFTEMVNNAIDHSKTDVIDVLMEVTKRDVRFEVRDYGIGVFKNIKEKKGFSDERLALAELTKGKMTTAPKWHSGEGIFFTSRAADHFRLTGGKLTLAREEAHDGPEVIEKTEPLKGTLVEFAISRSSKKHLGKDVFGQFSTDPEEPDFGKTEIAVRLFKRGSVHVSRSQAKRIMSGLEKFKVVTLDFDGVPMIGQGFADQIFRIFIREHPETSLVVENASDAVRFMIDRVRNTSR